MRILATFAAAFAAGIFGTVYLLPEDFWLPGCLIGFVLAICFYRKNLRLALVCAGLCAALGYHALYVSAVQKPLLELTETEQTVTMTLCEYPGETDWGAKVTVRLSGYRAGKAVYYGDESLLALVPGQTVTDEVSFSDASYVREDAVTTFTSKAIFLRGYSRGEPVYGEGERASLRYLPLRVGKAMGSVIHSGMEGDAAGFLTAILTGDTGTLSEAGKASLSEAGLYHILAVSGMHCGYLLAMTVLLIGRHRRRLLAVTTILLLAFYVILTGASPSVLRACVMMTFMLIAPVFRRESDGPTSLFAALMLILLVNPFAAASLSLQLSFAAMAGMLWLPERIYRGIMGKRRGSAPVRLAVSSFAATMGALVFTLPLTAIYFEELTLISPLSNLLCLWAAGVAFTTGLFAVTAGFLLPSLGQILAVIPTAFVRYILFAAEILARIPHHDVSLANPYVKYWLICVYALFALVWYFGRSGWKKYAAAAALAVVTLVITVKAGYLQYQSGLDAVILDVGQGQCVALKSGDEFALIDCGSSWENAGDIARHQLQAMGCGELDYLLLTHYDNDHVSGVTGLLAGMKVRQLLVSPDAEDASVQTAILKAAEVAGAEIISIYNRRSIPFGESEIIVYPPLGEKTDNERGLSVWVSSGEDSVFITGDMSQKTERLFLKTYALSDADVLVAGHHGAKNSTSPELLRTLDPDIVCISVGSNSYGHPHPDTLERLETRGCEIYRTDLQGDIHLSLNP